MTTDIDTLAAALYVTTNDLLKAFPEIAPPRPAVGAQVQLSDAELITLAVMQALDGYTSERRWRRGTPRRGTTMRGWWTPPRWNAPAPGTR